MALRPFKEPNGSPSLELADVGWRGGCSSLQPLQELLTDQNTRHSFSGEEKKVNGNRNLGNGSVPAVMITLFIYFGQCSSPQCADGRLGCRGRPGWIHTTQWRAEVSRAVPERLWAVSTSLYSHCFGISAAGDEAVAFLPTNAACCHCSYPHGVCRSLAQVLPTCLTCPTQVHTVTFQAAKWLHLHADTSLIHHHGWINIKNCLREGPTQCKPMRAFHFTWVWRWLCFSHEPMSQPKKSWRLWRAAGSHKQRCCTDENSSLMWIMEESLDGEKKSRSSRSLCDVK